jgi:hypothetical protein
MSGIFEIHRYENDVFQYTVACTDKYSEEKVRKDAAQMNEMMSECLKIRGIKYVFAIGTTANLSKGNVKKRKTRQPNDQILESV